MAASIFQATGMEKFKDGLRIGNQPEVRKSLIRVTIPEDKGIIVLWDRVDHAPLGINKSPIRYVLGNQWY